MSDKQSGQASQRKASTNKNIKKLRTISMVCGLASSWQKWVTENETKQASEPSGWSPSTLGGPTEAPKRTWVPKKPPSTQTKPTETSQNSVVTSGEAQKTPTPETQEAPKTVKEEIKEPSEPAVAPRIKVKQVVKTVTSGVQEKSAGIGLLTEKIAKESLPSNEDIDKILKKKNSPTRRRKCSNMVSSLTKSWKQVEKGQEGGGADKNEDKETVAVEEAETLGTITSKEDTEEESDVAVKIKRPSAPV